MSAYIIDVAKLIDPEAFDLDDDQMSPTERAIWDVTAPARRAIARDKAREILAHLKEPA